MTTSACNVAHASRMRPLFMAMVCLAYISSYVVEGQYTDEQSVVIPPAFQVVNVEQNTTTQQIVVTLRVGGGSKHVPILYMSKPDWSTNTPTQMEVSEHPCQPQFSGFTNIDKTCCLEDFVAQYQTGPDMKARFANNSDVCVADVSTVSSPSNGSVAFNNIHFPTAIISSTLLDTAGGGAPPAGVTYSSRFLPNQTTYEIEIRFTMDYLESRTLITPHPSLVGTAKYEFFIGCVFLSLQTYDSSVGTLVMQENIEFTKSEFGFFTIATEQDRSAIKSIDVFIHQAQATPAVDPGERQLQYVEVDFRYDTSLYSGGFRVEVDTMRYSRAVNYHDSNDWRFACKPLQGLHAKNESMFDDFSLQDCLPYAPSFCDTTNGRFTFPLSIDGVTATDAFIAGPDSTTSLFLAMNVVLIEGNGFEVMSTIYATISLASFPVLIHCVTSVFDYNSVTDIMKVTTGVGLRSVDNNLTAVSGADQRMIRKLEIPAATYGAASINMVIDGSEFFRNAFTTAFKFRIDNMLILNFLGASNTGYTAVMQQIATGSGFTIEKENTDPFYTITPAFSGGTVCTEVVDKTISTSNFNCMWRRVIIQNEVCPEFTESVHYQKNKTDDGRLLTEDWVKRTFFNIETNTNLSSQYLADRCPKFYDGIEGNIRTVGDYGCLFIDPGYRWMRAAGANMNPMEISDKTIIVGLVTLVNMDEKIVGRRLLSMNSDGSNMNMVPLADDPDGDDLEAGLDADDGVGEDAVGIDDPDLEALDLDDTEMDRMVSEYTDEVELQKFKTLWNITDMNNAMLTKELQPVRRRLLSSFDFWGTDKTVVSPAQMQKELQIAFAVHQMKTIVILSPEEMKRKLNAAFSVVNHDIAKRSTGTGVVSRHLLADDDDEEAQMQHMQKLTNESSSDMAEMSNPFVVPALNIAYMSNYARSDWQMFKLTLDKPNSMTVETLGLSINRLLLYTSKYIGSNVVSAQTTGFSVQTGIQFGSENRRLLSTFEPETIDIEGIMSFAGGFGTLYAHMLTCIIASAAQVNTPNTTITEAFAHNVVTACATANNALEEVSNVRAALLTACGNQTLLLPVENCSVLYSILRQAVPTTEFNWYETIGVEPSLYFTMESCADINSGNKAAIIDSTRFALSGILGVEPDKILIEIIQKDILVPMLASSRRLLSPCYIIMVWVYPDDGLRFTHPAWPPTPTPAGVAADYLVWSLAIPPAVLDFLGLIVMSGGQTVGITNTPLRPQGTEHSIVFAVDVAIIFPYTDMDIGLITDAIKNQLSSTLSVVPTSVRVLSIQQFIPLQVSRFSMEVRFPSALMAESSMLFVKHNAADIAKSIKVEASNIPALQTTIRSVTVVRSSLVAVVNSNKHKDEAKPLSTGVITAIILISMIGVATTVTVAYYYCIGLLDDRERKGKEQGGVAV
jgi:hypothetical protein